MRFELNLMTEYERAVQKMKGAMMVCEGTRFLLWLGICVVLFGSAGCQYYEDYRVKKATADLNEEKAALLHAYRLCLEKYQDQPPKAKEVCAVYTQQLRELEVTHR